MSASTLAAAVMAASEGTVSFGADGRERTLRDLAQQADALRRRLAAVDGQRWALDIDDPHDFASAFVGCMAAGKTPVIGAAQTIASARSGVEIDGFVTAQPRSAAAIPVIELSELPAGADKPMLDIDPNSDFVLYTSGSTGAPKEVVRFVRNFESEVAVFEKLWGDRAGKGRVYSTVSHRHVYGLLFRVLWPLISQRPFASFDLQFPEQLLGAIGAGNILISSPALLKRIGHLPEAAGHWRAIFSSGGLLPGEQAADAQRVLRACPIEVLGSTETSGVAWRCQEDSGDDAWAVFPRASVRVSGEGFLEVESPFSGVPGWLPMGDKVDLHSDGRFELLGRGDHIAKIEDKRISLAEIEQLLMKSGDVEDAAAVALESPNRQYIAAVVQLSPDGKQVLDGAGRRALSEKLLALLKPAIDPVGLPKRFRYVDRIPVNPQGKRIPHAIRQLFEGGQ